MNLQFMCWLGDWCSFMIQILCREWWIPNSKLFLQHKTNVIVSYTSRGWRVQRDISRKRFWKRFSVTSSRALCIMNAQFRTPAEWESRILLWGFCVQLFFWVTCHLQSTLFYVVFSLNVFPNVSESSAVSHGQQYFLSQQGNESDLYNAFFFFLSNLLCSCFDHYNY